MMCLMCGAALSSVEWMVAWRRVDVWVAWLVSIFIMIIILYVVNMKCLVMSCMVKYEYYICL